VLKFDIRVRHWLSNDALSANERTSSDFMAEVSTCITCSAMCTLICDVKVTSWYSHVWIVRKLLRGGVETLGPSCGGGATVCVTVYEILEGIPFKRKIVILVRRIDWIHCTIPSIHTSYTRNEKYYIRYRVIIMHSTFERSGRVWNWPLWGSAGRLVREGWSKNFTIVQQQCHLDISNEKMLQL
jgi:hypothetical protein